MPRRSRPERLTNKLKRPPKVVREPDLAVEEDSRPVFCLVVPWMSLGGADRCGLDLMAHYRKRGFRIAVVSTRKIRLDCQRHHSFELLADEIHCTQDVAAVVKNLQPVYTVVNNSHEAYDQAWEIKKAAPETKLVSLFHMILSPPWDFEKSLQEESPFDLVLSISNKLRGELSERGVPSERIETLYWFGFPEVKDSSKKRKTPAAPFILCPFRFHFQKRPEFVCDIALSLKGMIPEAMMPTFLFVGDGELYSKIKLRGEELGVSDWIEFKRGVDYSEMEKLYRSAAALVCPSVDEGIPLTYFEAMQWEVPLAVSDVGAVKELVPSEYLIGFEIENEAKEYAKLLVKHLTGQSGWDIHEAKRLVNKEFSKSVWDQNVERLIG